MKPFNLAYELVGEEDCCLMLERWQGLAELRDYSWDEKPQAVVAANSIEFLKKRQGQWRILCSGLRNWQLRTLGFVLGWGQLAESPVK